MEIVIGTAQFGLPYGITNTNPNRVSNEEIDQILSMACLNKINILDTAAAYGQSESVLGQLLSQFPKNSFKIITKTKPIRQKYILGEHVELIENFFFQSLEKLQQENIYCLMVHDANDLLVENGSYILDKINQFKEQKKIHKIGCSFYNPDDLFAVLEKFELDVVQIPINLFDQRFISSGALEYLKVKNIEIYVRSIFLQGLLLVDTKNLVSMNMSCVEPHIAQLDKICQELACSRLALIFSFLKKIQGIKVVIGFNSFFEFNEVLGVLTNNIKVEGIDFSSFQLNDLKIINPTYWSKK